MEEHLAEKIGKEIIITLGLTPEKDFFLEPNEELYYTTFGRKSPVGVARVIEEIIKSYQENSEEK